VKYKHYHVIGLQRTGTNWLHATVKENFVVERKQTFWKHLTPKGQNPNYHNVHGPAGSLLCLDPDVFYIATCKDFDTWCQSINKRRVDFWVSHIFPNEEKHFEDIYYPWIKWKNANLHKENFYYKDYKDWNSNWQQYFDEIKEITGWYKKHDNYITVNKRF
jgi:hypothetical protein